jgi:hypothetical protein
MQEFEVNPEHIMKDVYSYPFPEVRDLLREQQFDPDLTINTITRPEAQIMLSGYNFDPPLDLPSLILVVSTLMNCILQLSRG